MRELLLVRKLEEENAKKNKQNELPSPTSPENTSNIDSCTEKSHKQETQEVHQDTHDITLNNNSEISLLSGENTQNNPDINIVQNQTANILNTEIQQQLPILPDDNNSILIPLGTSTSNDVTSSDKTIHSVELAENINDLPEEKKHDVLQTKRESLKEFFLQKQPYIHKDSYNNNPALDPDLIETESQSPLSPISSKQIKKGNTNLSDPENLPLDSSNHQTDQIDSKLNFDEKRQKAAAD
ncbi:8894_t:CDS:2, partial [Racocetra persica]